VNQDRTDEHVQSRVECGCGFNATDTDKAHLRHLFATHPCPYRRGFGASWVDAIFSFWGYMGLMALALIAAVIFGSRP
jgi:hypothetical protein